MEVLGIDGLPVPSSTLAAIVNALAPDGAHVRSEELIADVVSGSERKYPTSHSCVLEIKQGSQLRVLAFMKIVRAEAMQSKAWPDLRRTLAFIRTELRFYREFAPILISRGVHIPKVAFLEEVLQAALEESEVVESLQSEEPSPESLKGCGAAIFIQTIDTEKYFQTSPLCEIDAYAAVRGLAGLHAAAWQDQSLLELAATRLQKHGGSFTLSIRNPKELAKLTENWSNFVKHFAHLNPTLFARPNILAFGERLERHSRAISRQLCPAPTDDFATLVHGDAKSLNMFLPKDKHTASPILIDFASCGVGYGMADLGMLLSHSVDPQVLAGIGEERILKVYLEELVSLSNLPFMNKTASQSLVAYARSDRAIEHYRLGVLDYGRFVVGRFWTDASPQNFEKRKDNMNVTLPNRDWTAALAFIERLDRYLASLEAGVFNAP
jgi:hypothetical protein